MIGRFIGSAVLQRVRTGFLLSLVAVMAFGLVILGILAHGHLAMAALLAVGICNSIMFPSIFTLGIQGLGPLTSKGSSLMIAAIVGGAIIPVLTGKLADHIGLQLAFLLPALCYVYIGGLGVVAIRRAAKTEILISETVPKKTRGALPAISRSEQRMPRALPGNRSLLTAFKAAPPRRAHPVLLQRQCDRSPPGFSGPEWRCSRRENNQ